MCEVQRECGMYQDTLWSAFVVCFTAVICASVVAVDTLPAGVKYLSLSAHTEEHVKDECDWAVACNFVCR